MEDVTNLLNRYRECVRHVWNTYYEPLRDDESSVAILPLQYELFSFMVVWQLGRGTYQESVVGPMPFGNPEMGFGSDIIPYLRIVPPVGRLGIELLVEEQISSLKFVYTAVKLQTHRIDLRFIEYFDWDTQYQRDWQYYRARILRSPDQPDLEGKTILLEVRDCTVLFLETEEERTAPYPI
jgi:hypothetical protein